VIHFEVDAGVAVATIDRPERKNALNAELCEQLRGHIEGCTARVVVITGAAGAFCSGADLDSRFVTGDDEFRPIFEALLDAVVAFEGPVIAAADGPALGAGTQLSVACDLRVANRNAVYGIPAGRLGLVLNPENVQRLALLVGLGVAREMLLSARRLSADDARAAGLVHRVVDGPALPEAMAWAHEIAALAPLTLQAHKRALNAVASHLQLRRTDAVEGPLLGELDALAAAAFRSADLQEGLAAFKEKRQPNFEGR